MSAMTRNERILVLFDVDGTLTIPREESDEETRAFLSDLKKRVVVGIVGGSDLPKQKEQLGEVSIWRALFAVRI
jgi:phosphomannomutase